MSRKRWNSLDRVELTTLRPSLGVVQSVSFKDFWRKILEIPRN